MSEVLYNDVQKNHASKITQTQYGVRYNVPIKVVGTKGKSMVLDTVWQIDKGSNIPRFITLKFDKRTIKEVKK